MLKPIWAVLPSPEARTGKLGARFRTASPTSSPVASKPSTSLSEMDVRSLKTLYNPATGHPSSPSLSSPAAGNFTIEAFVERVHALISDDRALIERLIRFAQAHDLLKKNAERAQKLAQESNIALETYQKQVKTLEERNRSMTAKQAALYVVTLVENLHTLTVIIVGKMRFIICKKLWTVYRRRNSRSRPKRLNRLRRVLSSRTPTTLSVLVH